MNQLLPLHKLCLFVKVAYWINGGTIYCFRKGGGDHIQYGWISSQNVMENLIHDNFSLFMFKSLKLICSNHCSISYYPTSTSLLNGLVSHH